MWTAKIWIFPWNIWLLQIFISKIPWQKSVALSLLRSLFSTSRADNQGGQGNADVFASHSAPILKQKVGVPYSKASRAKNLDSSTFEVAVKVSVAVRSLNAVCPGIFQDIACSAGCQAVFGVTVPWDSAPLTSWTCGCDFEIKSTLFDRACAPADLQVSNFEL